MKRALATSCLALTFATASFGFAPAASAGGSVGNCDTWITYSSPNYGNARCTNIAMFDKFRAKITCIDPHGKQWLAYGPWKKNGETSKGKCSTDTNVGVLKVGVSYSG